jgi:ankyrin repeat protein
VKLLLLTDNIDKDPRDSEGTTPLMWASENGHTEMFEFLVEGGAGDQPNTRDSNGETLLMTAAKRNIDALVTLFLDRYSADVNAVDDHEQTALILAWNSRDSGTIKLLVSRGAHLHPAADASLGEKLLLWAAKRGDDRLVKMLLDRHSVDHDAKDNGGHTALMLASNAGYLKVVELLIKSSADIEARNSQFQNATALQYAISKGHKDVEKMLRDEANKRTMERARIQNNAILDLASQVPLPQTPPPEDEPPQNPLPQNPPPQNQPPPTPPARPQLSQLPPPDAVLPQGPPPPLHLQPPSMPITAQLQIV